MKAVDRALTASDVVEAVDKGDLKEAGIAVGMAVLSVASKGKKEDKGKKKGTGALRRRKADRDALMAKSRQELGRNSVLRKTTVMGKAGLPLTKQARCRGWNRTT